MLPSLISEEIFGVKVGQRFSVTGLGMVHTVHIRLGWRSKEIMQVGGGAC